MQHVLRRTATIAKALAAQARQPPPPLPEPRDMHACAAALERAGAKVVLVHLEARREPWTPAGLDTEHGQPVTWLAHGHSWALGRRGPQFDATMQIRLRAGRRPPSLMGTAASHTEAAPNSGPLELCCLYPAELRGPEERLVYDRIMPRRVFGGGFDVVVAVWPRAADVARQLDVAATADPTGLCRAERERLARPRLPPPGWHRHPVLPLTGVHATTDDGIHAHSENRVEIIRRDLRAPLTPTLKLRWRWRLDDLASRLPEDTLFTHDYLSVAVEFDDGTDLTYYWSTGLPPETAFRCPYPHWREREWHLVVRSGRQGLGRWQQEERTIARDRDRAIPKPRPREVTRVWLIATTIAQRNAAHGTFADIELVDGDRVQRAS